MILKEAQGFVLTTIQNTVATITFSHPASNSFPSYLLDKLVLELDNVSKNENVTIVLLQSEGNGAFCAGASFDELLQIETLNDGKKFFSGFANVINAMRKCSKIIVGRIRGKAVGGGVGLAAATDYCLATQFSAIKLSELNIGIIPAVIEPAVERKIGLSSFSRLALNPTEFFPPEWAKEQGLFMEVYENIETMDEAIENLANKLANYSPEALTELKKILWKNTEGWDVLLSERAEVSGRLVLGLELE